MAKSDYTLSQARKFIMRADTRLREYIGKLPFRSAPKQIVFVHVPKSAGTSILDHIQACVGGKKSGRTVKLDEFVLGEDVSESAVQRGREARFCTGHITFATAQAVARDNDAFVFTVLREPRQRLWSLYNYLHGNRFPASMIPRQLTDLYADITEMTPRQFFGSDDPRLRYVVDNVMVRQVAGDMRQRPTNDAQWRELLAMANRNLVEFDHVGFAKTYDRDFMKIVAAVDLPAPSSVPHSKKSQPSLRTDAERLQAFEVFQEDVGDLIEPLVRWDAELYDHAVSSFCSDTA